MSKQSVAKQRQGYIDKVDPATCGNCQNFQRDFAPPAWMIERNKNAEAWKNPWPYPQDVLDANSSETNLRCGIGGFAVKKMGGCSMHKRKCGCCNGTGKIKDSEFIDGDERACMTCDGSGHY